MCDCRFLRKEGFTLRERGAEISSSGTKEMATAKWGRNPIQLYDAVPCNPSTIVQDEFGPLSWFFFHNYKIYIEKNSETHNFYINIYFELQWIYTIFYIINI